MHEGRPSRTALGSATHRAVHQVLEGGRIFADPLAIRILGGDIAAAVQDARDDPSKRRLRLFIAVRTRFAEDALQTAIQRGVRQLVVLGAGLDTYAYRATLGREIRVFEVDHPATQAWKRRLLQEASIPIPAALTFAGVDFEREGLGEGLAASGFDCDAQTFFTWLGVVPYLTEAAVESTLRYIGRLGGGAHVAFDYANPQDSAGEPDALSARVASIGEPFQSYFETPALHRTLGALGFREIEDLGPPSIRERYFPGRGGPPLPERGGHIVRATSLP